MKRKSARMTAVLLSAAMWIGTVSALPGIAAESDPALSIESVNPFTANLNNTADVTYDTTNRAAPDVISKQTGSWFSVRDVEFTESTAPEISEEDMVLALTNVDSIEYHISVISVDKTTTASMHPASSDGTDRTGSKGTGRIEVRMDSPAGEVLTSIDFDSPDAFTTIYNREIAEVRDTHDLYFVFSDSGIAINAWAFLPDDSTEEELMGDVNADGNRSLLDLLMLQKYLLNAGSLTDAGAADMDQNHRIDVFDLVLLKKALLSQ